MIIGLICSENIKGIIKELLIPRNITIDDNSGLFIVEAGHELPSGKISMVFDMSTLASLIDLLEKLGKNSETINTTIVGKANDKYEIIPINQIHFYEARDNTIFCITAKGEYRVKEKLYELEETLPNDRFIRISKSFIVNITNVKEIIPWFGRRLVLRFNDSKKEVEVSKNFVKGFKTFLGI